MNTTYGLSLEDIPANIAIYKPTDDENFIFVEFNKHAELTAKISKDKLIGKKVTDIFPGIKAMGLFDVLLRVSKTGKKELFNFEYYQDKRISGWKKNKVSRLDNGLIFVLYEDIDEKDIQILTYGKQLDVKTKEIAELKERYEIAINGISDGLWDFNLLTNELYLSPRWKEMLGYRDDELENKFKTWKDLMHPYDTETVLVDIKLAHSSEDEMYENIHRLKHKNGHWVWILARGKTIFNKDGIAIRMVGFHTDITKSKEMQSKIADLKERMELALSGNNAGVYEWYMLDNSAYYSLQWMKMLGYKDSELPPHLSTWQDRVHPDDIEEIMLNVQKAIEAKEKHIQTVHRLKHKNGHWIWILGRGLIRYNEKGIAYSMVGIHTDITKDKIREFAYTERGKIVEDSLNEICIFDATNFKFLYLNQAAQDNIGYTVKEIREMTPLDVRPYLTQEDVVNILKPIMNNNKKSVNFSTINRRKDGTEYNIDVYLQKTTYQSHDAYVAFSVDITQRIEAENEIKYLNSNLQKEVSTQLIAIREKDEQLFQQSKLAQMGEMISMIAHQWRQPLNAISATGIHLSMLSSMDNLEDEKVQKDSEFIQNQCQKMSATINTFMDFIKPSKESIRFKPTHTVEAILQIMGTQLINHNIIVNVKTTNENISMIGYEDLLEQVIINLLSNSRDAFEELEIADKYIKIAIDIKDNIPIITIEDNAGGVPHDIQEKIFNPYFTTKEEGKGTGIGLYMSKDIMKKSFKGDLVYSNTDDGSCFKIVCGTKE